jgi:dipeptidase E
MQFFLTGGGDFEHFRKVDHNFRELLQNGDKLQILPYASDPEDFEEIYERVEETYGRKLELEFSMEEDISNLTEEILTSARAIFIEGGNTFDLVTAMRKSNLETLFKAIQNQPNKIIYADSAGAIILGNTVKTAFFGDDADEDEERLQDYRGMDLLGSWSIHAHYTNEDDDTVMNLVYDEGNPVLALPEETGIHISEGKEVEVLTETPLAIFTAAGKQQIESGKKILLADFF